MALLYRKIVDDVTYEVRSAGRTRRLYTNGVLHTQYNPGRIWGNGIWDALAYPALLTGCWQPRVLLLGLGGGAVLHVLQQLLEPRRLTAIEIDPVHIGIARRWFGIEHTSVDIVHADAFNWVPHCKDAFDVIVDDVFLHHPTGDPYRPTASESAWRAQLRSLQSGKGVLIRNHIDPTSSRLDAQNLTSRGDTVIECRVTGYCNVVTAAFQEPFNLRSARARNPGPRVISCSTARPPSGISASRDNGR